MRAGSSGSHAAAGKERLLLSPPSLPQSRRSSMKSHRLFANNNSNDRNGAKQQASPEGTHASYSNYDLGESRNTPSPILLILAVLEFPPASTNSLKTSGLHQTPQSGGVQNATARCDLPSPAVAVRNLVEQAQFAHLCTIMSNMHHRRAGYPFGTVVDFATDGAGCPIFSLSPLAIQTRNIIEDPRCSLVMQMPGWNGLANARVTMFGDVYKLPNDLQDAAADIFHGKISTDDTRFVSGNAIFFRMDRILDIYFVGGFGTVQWLDTEEYMQAQPDAIVLEHPSHTLQVLNQKYCNPLRELFGNVDDAAFISIDRLGADVRIRSGGEYSVERLGFNTPVEALADVQKDLDARFPH